MNKVLEIINISRAIIAEILSKISIRYAFTYKIRLSVLLLYLSDIIYKNSRRAYLLKTYFQIINIKIYQCGVNRVDDHPPLNVKLKIPNKGRLKKINNKIKLLNRSWEKPLLVPRQLKTKVDFNPEHSIKIKTDKIIHLITDDHEWSITPGKSFGNDYLSLYEAEIQLIKKGNILNQIASDFSIPWVHLIDIGSYLLIEEAAKEFPTTWGRLLSDFNKFLINTIKTGNDLGVHVHSEKSHLAIKKIEKEKIYIRNDVLSWGELPGIGSRSDVSTKLGFITKGKSLIEEYGKNIKQDFTANFFRAGGYSTGRNINETKNTMKVLEIARLKISSDALLCDEITESLGRPSNNSVYFAKHGYPWLTEENPESNTLIQALPLRTNYMPNYSVIEAARIFQKNKNVLKNLIRCACDGNKIAISIDHDIEIGNGLSGGDWESLDTEKGDWLYLQKYLEALKNSNSFKFIDTQEFAKLLEKK